MRGKKTSLIEALEKVVLILKKNKINEIAYGIIIPVKKRKDHRVSVKIQEKSGAILISATGKRYKQEIRVYGAQEKEMIKKILQEKLGENYRFL